jgi:hypothetical protein
MTMMKIEIANSPADDNSIELSRDLKRRSLALIKHRGRLR